MMIYQDPITKCRYEGEAVPVSPFRVEDVYGEEVLARGEVRFTGEKESYERLIAISISKIKDFDIVRDKTIVFHLRRQEWSACTLA